MDFASVYLNQNVNMPTSLQEESIKLGNGPIPTAKVFKYVGVDLCFCDRRMLSDINNRVKSAWENGENCYTPVIRRSLSRTKIIRRKP